MTSFSRTGLVAASVLTGLVSACGTSTGPASSAPDDAHAESPSPAPASASSTPKNDPPAHTVPCEKLIESGWTAPAGEPDMSWDPETGYTRITFGEEKPLEIDIFDPACAKVPDISTMVTSALRGHEERQATECASAVEQVIGNEPPVKAGADGRELAGDLDEVRHFVSEWCPTKYETQLQEAGY